MAANLNDFIKANRPTWQETERLLERIEQDELTALPESDVRRFGELYRTISNHLIVARTQFSNPDTEDYLNDLVARSYVVIYQSRRSRAKDLWEFFKSGVPRMVRGNVRAILVTLGIFLFGSIFGLVAGMVDPESVLFLVPAPYSTTPPDAYLEGKGSLHSVEESATMMSVITTNNLRVGVLAFAAGITFGIGTAALVFYNGAFFMSFATIFLRAGKGFEFFSLIVPHGLIEFSAIFIASSAGFVLAGALVAPGEVSHRRALRERGISALKLFLGSIPIFLAAMIVESTVAKFQAIGPIPKYGIGILALLAMLAWLLFGGRRLKAQSNPLQ